MKLTEETYINLAEKVINELSRSKKIVRGREQPIKLITTSKIRNLLAIMMDIKNDSRACRKDSVFESKDDI